jgi:tripartite-type tricarboxylate transporter receptor subunit TctC
LKGFFADPKTCAAGLSSARLALPDFQLPGLLLPELQLLGLQPVSISISRRTGDRSIGVQALITIPQCSNVCSAVRRRSEEALGAILVLLTWLAPCGVQAQKIDWPHRPVSVIVGYAAGGNTDVMARMAAKKLSEDLQQSFIVENRIGAGGAIAAAYAAQAPPDGYTVFFAASPQIAIVPKLQKVNYDAKDDFAPVRIFGTGPFVLGIRSSIPARTIPEFVAFAKARRINYGSSGVGSVAHLAAALFAARAGFEAAHIPFRGSSQVTGALLGEQIDMFFGNASDLVPQADSGKVTLLGVAAPSRMRQLPNVPTISETYPGTSLESWNGFLVPTRTPREIIRKLAEHVIAAAKDPAVVAQLTALGIQPNGTTPEEFVAQIDREQPQFDAAIKAANLHPE